MGKGNIAVKQFLRNKDRFADLVNVQIFGGELVVKAEELEEIDSEASMLVNDKRKQKKGLQRYRDIVMRWKKGPFIAILACENQEKVHYAMPVRMMLYDGLSYADQIRQMWKKRNPAIELSEDEFLSRFCKEDRIYPVISLVFYYGETAWDGSGDLYGMFWQEDIFREQKFLESYVPNYTLNIVDAGNVSEVERFRTDLQFILGMLQYSDKDDGMREYVESHKEYFEHVDIETYRAIQELLHSKKKLRQLLPEKSGEEDVNMCRALEALYNDGVSEGIEKGIEEGIRVLVKTCKEFELSKEQIIEKIEKEFSMPRETAEKFLL